MNTEHQQEKVTQDSVARIFENCRCGSYLPCLEHKFSWAARLVQTDPQLLEALLQNSRIRDDPRLFESIRQNSRIRDIKRRDKDLISSELRALLARRYCKFVLRSRPLIECLHTSQQDDDELAFRYGDPFYVEAQTKFEDALSEKGIYRLCVDGLVDNPKAIPRLAMPHVHVKVWGVRLEALVDINAKSSMMSKACAERCGLLRILDTTCECIAHVAGQQKIIGRIHSASVKFGENICCCSFLVMDSGDMEFLVFGRDMLCMHEFFLDTKLNVFGVNNHFGVTFLQDKVDEERQLKRESRKAQIASEGIEGMQMVEVFGMVVNNSGDLWGEITYNDGLYFVDKESGTSLYNQDISNCERIEAGQSAALIVLSNDMLAMDGFWIIVELKLKDKDKGTVHKISGEIKFHPYFHCDDVDKLVTRTFTGGDASVTMRLAVLSDAVVATVEVKCVGRRTGGRVYGLLYASSDMFSECPTTTLFKKSCEEVKKECEKVEEDCELIRLTRSDVVVSLDSTLKVHAYLKDVFEQYNIATGVVEFPAQVSGTVTQYCCGIQVNVTFSVHTFCVH